MVCYKFHYFPENVPRVAQSLTDVTIFPKNRLRFLTIFRLFLRGCLFRGNLLYFTVNLFNIVPCRVIYERVKKYQNLTYHLSK
jgi:hypothetical protein